MSFTPVLNFIGLTKQHPLDWNQPDHVVPTDPNQAPPCIMCQEGKRALILRAR